MPIKKIEIFLQKKIVIFLIKSCSPWDLNLRKVFLPSNATTKPQSLLCLYDYEMFMTQHVPVAKWYSTRLACQRSWVQHQGKGRNMKNF